MTCHDLISKHGVALQKAVTDLESDAASSEQGSESMQTLSKKVTERAALFRITSTVMISTSSDFLQLAQEQSKRWRKAIIHERSQRIRMEETVETLAKQHNTLEKAIRSEGKMYEDNASCNFSDESDLEEWTDASDGYGLQTTEKTVQKDAAVIKESDNLQPSSGLNNSVQSRSLTLGKIRNSNERSEPRSSLTTKSQRSLRDTHSLNQLVNKELKIKKEHRTSIPFKPDYSLSLWSIMKNCIGRDLSKIPMPVNFNEPLSMLQRLGEDCEYCDLLHKAADIKNSLEQMAYVVAFSISGYASTIRRIGKPFNPLLGETFELDRRDDMGIRMLCEQVGHHPPCAAFYLESKDCGPNSGWSYWTDITVSSKFRGKYLNVTPLGTMHLKFHASGNHYTWKKVTTTVHNIIVGKLWVDQSGECEVVNHTTGDKCKHKYHQYSYFSRDVVRKVTGTIEDKHGVAQYVISGTWDKFMEFTKNKSHNETSKKQKGPKRIWVVTPSPPNSEKMYFFSTLAMSLNEPDDSVAPTDSRNRPDQRLMEEGNWDAANEVKVQLEQAQRSRRAARKAALSSVSSSESIKKNVSVLNEGWTPVWFKKATCDITGESYYKFNNEYWNAKEKKDWSKCTEIFVYGSKAGETSKNIKAISSDKLKVEASPKKNS